MSKIKVIKSEELSSAYDKRYIIINTETGEVVDDAQGYGYKTPQKAHAAYAYKNRSKKEIKRQKAEEKEIVNWMKEHKDFVECMDLIAFEILKGSWDPDEKFDTKFLRKMLKENDLEISFSVSKLLKAWRNDVGRD